jgi:hypothetical protein
MIPLGKAPTEAAREVAGQALQQLFSIAGARGSSLLLLDDALPDEPVRGRHDSVDRARRGTPRVFDDTHDVSQ